MFIGLTRNLFWMTISSESFITFLLVSFPRIAVGCCRIFRFCSWVGILFILFSMGIKKILTLNGLGFFETSGIKIKVFPQPAPHLSVQAGGSLPGHFPLQPTWKEGKVPGWETEEEGRYYTKNSEILFQNKRKQTSFQYLQPSHHRENPVTFWVIY